MDGTNVTTGVMGSCLRFNGTDEYAATGSATNPASEITVSSWIFPDDLSTYDRGILSKQSAFGHFIKDIGDQAGFYYYKSGGIGNEYNVGTVPEGSWSFLVSVFDGPNTDIISYLDNTNPGTLDVDPDNSIDSFSSPYFIGDDAFDLGNRIFSGKIDELRISNTVRTSGWIYTEYNNQFNTSVFYSIGSVQSL